MITIPPAGVASAAAAAAASADAAGAPPAAPDAAAPSPGADPLAQFGATHGLHPQVQALAYASPNGVGGGAPKASPTVYDVKTTDAATIAKLKASPPAPATAGSRC